MRRDMEPLLFEAGVDLVLSGQTTLQKQKNTDALGDWYTGAAPRPHAVFARGGLWGVVRTSTVLVLPTGRTSTSRRLLGAQCGEGLVITH